MPSGHGNMSSMVNTHGEHQLEAPESTAMPSGHWFGSDALWEPLPPQRSYGRMMMRFDAAIPQTSPISLSDRTS